MKNPYFSVIIIDYMTVTCLEINVNQRRNLKLCFRKLQ